MLSRWLTGGGTILCLAVLTLASGAADKASEDRMRKDITTLSSDAFEGRGVTTKGVDLAADYIADAFKQAGLKPGGDGATYFQPFTMPGATLGSPNVLNFADPKGAITACQLGKQFEPLGMSHNGLAKGAVVFVGYGITTDEKTGYDDYKDVDASDKIVIVLRDAPRSQDKKNPFGGGKRRDYASFTMKMQNAVKHKAAAILFVNDRETASEGDELLRFGFLATAPSPAKIPALHVQRATIDAMLHASRSVHLEDLEKEIDKDLKPQSANLEGWSAKLDVIVKRGTIDVKNVVGVLEGAGPLAKETVVIGAHYDHLGYGGLYSLSNLRKQVIHHGADDNGSGTTTLLELARRFGASRERQGRRLVFIAFSGEESGLLGSVHYCKHPIYPLDSTVAMVNMDMVGRLRQDKKGGWAKLLSLIGPAPVGAFPVLPLAHALVGVKKDFLEPKDKLIVYGVGTAKTFDQLIEKLNVPHDFRLNKIASGIAPSDQTSFYLKKIPVFFFFTGEHADYHRPGDTADKVNVAGMARIADLVQDVVRHLAEAHERPEYVKVVEPQSNRPEGRIPRLGIRPDYSDAESGVLLSGVSDDGPAAKAGLKEGDRIVGLGGKPVKDLTAYMSLISGQKVGQPIELEILRGVEKKTFKVIPE